MLEQNREKLQFYLQQHPQIPTINHQNYKQELTKYFNPDQINIQHQASHFLNSENILSEIQQQFQMNAQLPMQKLINILIQNNCDINLQCKKQEVNDEKIEYNNQYLQQSKSLNIQENNTQEKTKNNNEQIEHENIPKIEEKNKIKRKNGNKKNTQENLKNQTQPQTSLIEDAKIKARLQSLFLFYIKKQCNQAKLKTFDQIQSSNKVMNITIWMRFNRDFNTMDILSKEQIHKIYKQQSQNRKLNFQKFYNAIKQILRKKQFEEKGWKFFNVSQEKEFHNKLKELGVPFLDNQNTKKIHYNLPLIKTKNQDKKEQSMRKDENISIEDMNVQKLNNLKLKFQFPIQADEQDKIYLKQYLLDEKKQKDTKKHHIKVNQMQRQDSEGILNRIDSKIKRYLRH